MASGLSRRCIGALRSQPSIGLAFAGTSRLSGWDQNICAAATSRRRYTTPARQKQKTSGTAKTSKTATLKSASAPKVSTKASAATTQATPTAKGARKGEITNGPSKAISRESTPEHQLHTAPSIPDKNLTKLNRTSGGIAHKAPEKEEKKVLTEEEQIAQVDYIMAMAKLFPTADPWGQSVDTLDVTIPYSVKPSALRNYPSPKAVFDQFLQNVYNQAKNATSMLLLAQSDAIPGVDLSEATRMQKLVTQWPWRIFTTTSVKSNGWMASFRQTALSTYQQLNVALAQQNGRVIKDLTASTYQYNLLRLMKKNQAGVKYVWRFHRELSPTRVISIRGTEGYLASQDPKIGNRMMVHALVRIDSEQSLEMYDAWGRPLHRPATDDAATIKSASRNGSPAERKRVTEYLVFEKRMWYDGPWVIREQMWEAPGRVAAV